MEGWPVQQLQRRSLKQQAGQLAVPGNLPTAFHPTLPPRQLNAALPGGHK